MSEFDTIELDDVPGLIATAVKTYSITKLQGIATFLYEKAKGVITTKLEGTIKSLQEEARHIAAENAALKDRINVLEDRLGRTSANTKKTPYDYEQYPSVRKPSPYRDYDYEDTIWEKNVKKAEKWDKYYRDSYIKTGMTEEQAAKNAESEYRNWYTLKNRAGIKTDEFRKDWLGDDEEIATTVPIEPNKPKENYFSIYNDPAVKEIRKKKQTRKASTKL